MLTTLLSKHAGTGTSSATLTDTSDDGKLSARYLSDRRGILFRAQFPELTLQNHTFEATTESWVAAVGGGTLTRSTTSPLVGIASLNYAWTTGGSTQGISRSYTGSSIIAGGRRIRVAFTLKLNESVAAGKRTAYFKAYNSKGKVCDSNTFPWPGETTTRNWFYDFWLASDQNIAKIEIGITGASNNHSFKLDNVKITAPSPQKIRFVRVTDGGYIRGGDPAEAVAGVAYAYDDELTPGQFTEWAAEPIFDTPWRNSVPFFPGPRTSTVGFTITDRNLTLFPSHLVKSLETPGLLMYLMTNQRQVTRSRQASFVNKQNTGKPAGGISSAYSMSGQYQLITTTRDEKRDLELILDDAVLYIQPPGQYNRPPFYATVTSYTVNDFGKMSDPEKIFMIEFQEVERPDTFGQPNYLPLRDYSWLAGQYLTYGDVALTDLTYDQLSFSSVP